MQMRKTPSWKQKWQVRGVVETLARQAIPASNIAIFPSCAAAVGANRVTLEVVREAPQHALICHQGVEHSTQLWKCEETSFAEQPVHGTMYATMLSKSVTAYVGSFKLHNPLAGAQQLSICATTVNNPLAGEWSIKYRCALSTRTLSKSCRCRCSSCPQFVSTTGSIVESSHTRKCFKPSVLASHTVQNPRSACKKTHAERALSLTQTASHGNNRTPDFQLLL